MANRHFAKVADVWKHLPLVEVLSIERPRRYWESHAGRAVYEMADDAERRSVVGADGMAALHQALTSSDPGSTLAHIDPYDPCAVGAGACAGGQEDVEAVPVSLLDQAQQLRPAVDRRRGDRRRSVVG